MQLEQLKKAEPKRRRFHPYPAFLSYETLLDLKSILKGRTAEWLPKAHILEDPSPEKSRGKPYARKRNQNWPMQKTRRQIKLKAYEARKI